MAADAADVPRTSSAAIGSRATPAAARMPASVHVSTCQMPVSQPSGSAHHQAGNVMKPTLIVTAIVRTVNATMPIGSSSRPYARSRYIWRSRKRPLNQVQIVCSDAQSSRLNGSRTA